MITIDQIAIDSRWESKVLPGVICKVVTPFRSRGTIMYKHENSPLVSTLEMSLEDFTNLYKPV